jgi:hypothetical protein
MIWITGRETGFLRVDMSARGNLGGGSIMSLGS